MRAAARRIAAASSVAVFEDLGVQMNRYSTLVSYLEKLVWLLTGNLGRPGAQYSPTSLASLVRTSRRELDPATPPRSPVVGARIISGLIPCNVIPDEILTDHPQRYRAMIVESGNPAHSIADSQRMRQAIEQLDVVVCIDVFMTETARLADYVLPATDAVREARGDVLQLRVPAQRVPPAPAGRRAAGRAAARAGDPRPARRGRRAAHGRPTSPRCGPPPSRAGPSSPPPSPRRRAPTRGSGRSPPSCCTARSGRRCPTAPRAPPRCGRSPSAAR